MRSPFAGRDAAAALFAFALYAWTGARGPILGDGLELVAVSRHLGVAHPPGYPLFTLLGFVWQSLLPGLEPYRAMQLLNALLGAVAVLSVARFCRVAIAERWENAPAPITAWLPPLLAVLLGCATALWGAVTVVEVYALNAALLAAFVCAAHAKPGEPAAPLLLGLPLGLAAANHLPALAFAPVAAAALFDRTAVGASLRRIALCAGVCVATATILYGTIPIRGDRSAPAILWGSPYTLPRLLQHLRGGEYALYQFLQERTGVPFTLSTWWSFALRRCAELWQHLGGQLPLGSAHVGAPIAIVAIVAGAADRWHARPLLVLSLLLAAFAQFAFTLLYNIPDVADYFLGILCALAPLALCGAIAGARRAIARAPGRESRIVALAAALALIGLLGNWRTCDRSKDDSGAVWIERTLAVLPEGAAVLTDSDAGVYLLWYAQFARGERRDLLVYGTNFQRFPWFARTMPPAHPAARAVRFSEGAPRSLEEYVSSLRRDAIEPLLTKGLLFSLQTDPLVLRELGRYYDIVPRAGLLSAEEASELLEAPGPIRGLPPSILLEIRNQRRP